MKYFTAVIFLSIFLCTLCLGGEPEASFAIYLVTKDNKDIQKIELSELPIITDADIKEYDWENHRIILTEEALKRLPDSKEVGVFGKPFIVMANDVRCYRGAFWISVSSISHANPVINVFSSKHEITIERAYPSAKFAKGNDPRNDLRIYNALKNLKKLKEKE